MKAESKVLYFIFGFIAAMVISLSYYYATKEKANDKIAKQEVISNTGTSENRKNKAEVINKLFEKGSKDYATDYSKILVTATEDYVKNICKDENCKSYKIEKPKAHSSKIESCFADIKQIDTLPFFGSYDNIQRIVLVATFNDNFKVAATTSIYNYRYESWIPENGFSVKMDSENGIYTVWITSNIQKADIDSFTSTLNEDLDNICRVKTRIDKEKYSKKIWQENEIK